MVLPRSLKPVLERFRARLREHFGDRLRRITLFGSFAAGSANEDSDVDVLVVIDDLSDAEITIVAGVTAELSASTGFDISPLPLATDRYDDLGATGLGIVAEIRRTGVCL